MLCICFVSQFVVSFVGFQVYYLSCLLTYSVPRMSPIRPALLMNEFALGSMLIFNDVAQGTPSYH